MKVLVICDDLWHPAEIVEMGLKSFKEGQFDFDIIKTAKDILTPEMIAKYPVIVCCKGNSINAANKEPWFEEGVTEVGPKEFEEYVKNGGGYISLHASNTSREGSKYTAFIGNFFCSHPPRCGIDVKMLPHPITEGVEDFHIRDEHYIIKITADDTTAFCKTYSEKGGEQIGGYTREIGKGKLCVLTPGHNVDVWYNKSFQKLLTNAINWCCLK